MKIAILAPDLKEKEVNLRDSDPFLFFAIQALLSAGHRITIFSGKCEQITGLKKRSSSLTITPVLKKIARDISQADLHSRCLEDPFTLEEKPGFDLFIARGRTSEAWIRQAQEGSGAKVLYFPRLPLSLETETTDRVTPAAEIRLLDRVIYCATSYREQQAARELSGNPKNISRIPVWTKEGEFRSNEFVKRVEKLAERKETLYRGQIMTVIKKPVWHQNTLIPMEQVLMSGSVHVIPYTARGRLLFIQERRPGDHQPRLRVISGSIEPREKPEEAARRELEEETGIKARRLEKILTIPGSGPVKEKYHYFWAREITFNQSSKDPSEDIRGLISLSPAEFEERLLQGKFGTSRAVNALLKLLNRLKKRGGS